MSYQRNIEIKKDDTVGKMLIVDYEFDNECKFDKKKHICEIPFYDVEIKANGDVYQCCPSWNPVVIGNLHQEDIKDIWNGKKANIVRESILDSSYRYCNPRICPAMIAGGGNRIIPTEKFKNPNRELPRNFSFSIDNTCNLMCPSCRKDKILTSPENFRKGSLEILQKIFRSIFDKPHNEEVIMTFDGAGEIFHSAVYREIFETEEAFKNFDKWPNFKVVLCTNGTMMTEKIQQKYDYLFKRSLGIRISIDAGNKSSYEKVRKGGNWDLLWENINYLYHNTLPKIPRVSWAWNLILQDDNFESLPELVNLAYKYSNNLPEIYITNMLDWGIMNQEEFGKKAVWLPSSPRHELMKQIFSQSDVVNYPKMFKPF